MSSTFQLMMVLGFAGIVLALLVGMPQFWEFRCRKRQRALLIAQYRHTVSRYRLSKMLAYIGIKLDDYLTRIPPAAIQQHIINCNACPNIPACDRCLRDGEYISDMNFCPNYKSLMTYSRIMPSVE